MVKSILFSMFAVALFAAGAVGSWYIMNLQKQNDDAAANEALVSEVKTAPEPKQSPKPDLSEYSTPLHAKALNGEDIFRFTAMNKKNLQLINEQKESLRQEELRLNLFEKDLEVRKQEIEGILKQSQRTVTEAESMIQQLQAEVQQLKAAKDANATPNQDATPNVDDDAQANIKVSASWLQMMPPEKAAEALKSLANDGKKELVLKLLKFIEDRNVAKILEAMDDPALVAELTHSFYTARRTTRK